MADPMDTRLREAARRWQAQQPPPPGVPERLTGRPAASRSRIPASIAVAALVVAVVLATTWLARDGSPAPTSPVPTSSPGPTAAPRPVPWADLPATHPHGAAKYRAIWVAADLDLTARAGSTLEFTVYLVAAEATALDPCPDYSIWVGRVGGPRRSLNCAAVPYVDASGVPYLPANVPVAFVMRLRVPDLHGQQKLLWVLQGPQSLPGTHGVLTIHR